MAFTLRIGRCPRDGVELVVAHRGARGSGVHHCADQFERPKLAWSTIHKIAHENCSPARMPPRPMSILIAEFMEQGFQPVGMAVNVTNNVLA
jgi:hypothetical protein